MIREYVDGHKFNGITWSKAPQGAGHKRVCFVKGAIKCNGVPMGFAAWDYTLRGAEKIFQIYLDPRCICVVPTNKYGETPKCPVHGDWTKEKDGIEYHTNGAGI